MPVFYLMRVKGKAKIPDYIQVRDEQLTLIGYIRPGRDEKLAKIVDDPDLAQALSDHIQSLSDYGRITRIEI